MGLKANKLPSGRVWVRIRSKARKWYKSQSNRWRRRLEKQDPENVPPRQIKGWAD